MRIDHHAYHKATSVAFSGLLLQIAVGMTLLLFGRLNGDTTFVFGSFYVLSGLIVWLSLMITFYQHKLERLEALEEDELASTREDVGSLFDEAADEIRVAGRRLRLMHKWLMPIVSLVIAGLLAIFGFAMIGGLNEAEVGDVDFLRTEDKGWAIAICLGFAVIAFIYSRFVAGMAKQAAWQNLRGGAAVMVGNALVLVAIAVGIAFRYFENDGILNSVAWGLPIFHFVLAGEIALNFILNLYRPRIPGEVPRPAFDSKLLSLFSAPDNLVRSLNEAVNYQFGFDITSSWGYQLFLRSIVGLIALGVVVTLLLDMMVVVEPYQQAVKLSGGRIVSNDTDDVHQSGIMWKLPWPFQSSVVEDVTRVRTLDLTPRIIRNPGTAHVRLWSEPIKFQTENVPFIVGAPESVGTSIVLSTEEFEDPDDSARAYALLDAEIILEYRIRSTKTGSTSEGLRAYLEFASDVVPPRERFSEREKILRDLAIREIRSHMATLNEAAVLSSRRHELAVILSERVQRAFDNVNAGVEVVGLTFPLIRPYGPAASEYVDLAIAIQNRDQVIAEASSTRDRSLAYVAGSVDAAEELLGEILLYNEMEAGSPERSAQRDKIETMLNRANGHAALTIAQAEGQRWIDIMGARTEAGRVQRELPGFQAAPQLYRQRAIMRVLMRSMSNPLARVFIVGIDPERFDMDIDYKELNVLNFGDALSSSEEGQE